MPLGKALSILKLNGLPPVEHAAHPGLEVGAWLVAEDVICKVGIDLVSQVRPQNVPKWGLVFRGSSKSWVRGYGLVRTPTLAITQVCQLATRGCISETLVP